MSKTYTYALRDAANGNKVVSGSIHADSLDEASRRAIRRCGLTVRQSVGRFYTDSDFIRNGRKVYLSVGVPAEYYLDAVDQ